MKYYIIAGEASGDLHGSNLIRALREQDPAADIRCWGGDRMAAAGGHVVRHIRDLAFMGFIEVIKQPADDPGEYQVSARRIYWPTRLMW